MAGVADRQRRCADSSPPLRLCRLSASFSLFSFLSWVGGRVSEKLPRLRVPSAERKGKMAWRLCRSVVLPHETMEPVLDAFTDSHPPRGRPERLAVITGSFQIFPDRRWASLRLGTNARLPPKWHVCLSVLSIVCSLRCARRLPRATSTN